MYPYVFNRQWTNRQTTIAKKQRLQKKKMKKIMISPFFKISRNENIIITTRLVNDFEHVRLQWNPLNAQLSELRNFLYSFMGLYVERQHEYVCRSSNNLLWNVNVFILTLKVSKIHFTLTSMHRITRYFCIWWKSKLYSEFESSFRMNRNNNNNRKFMQKVPSTSTS